MVKNAIIVHSSYFWQFWSFIFNNSWVFVLKKPCWFLCSNDNRLSRLCKDKKISGSTLVLLMMCRKYPRILAGLGQLFPASYTQKCFLPILTASCMLWTLKIFSFLFFFSEGKTMQHIRVDKDIWYTSDYKI